MVNELQMELKTVLNYVKMLHQDDSYIVKNFWS